MSSFITGRVCLITGAARGMGYVTAKALAKMGAAKVIMVDWEGELGTRARDEINAQTNSQIAEFLYCDMSSLRQVQGLAVDICDRYDALHVLINNVGITDPVRRLSEEGFEMHLATCHLGPLLLTQSLLPLLKTSQPARILFISSDAHKAGDGVDFDDFNNDALWPGPVSNNAAFQAYHRAKLCNLYTSNYLAKKLQHDGVTVNAVSPGYFVNTSIYRNMTGVFKLGCKVVFGIGTLLGLNTPSKGARSHIYLASDDAVGSQTGQYWEHCKTKQTSELGQDTEIGEQLWNRSQGIISPYLVQS